MKRLIAQAGIPGVARDREQRRVAAANQHPTSHQPSR
jgi:hypothetical protein